MYQSALDRTISRSQRVQLAQGDGTGVGEDPEGRVHGLGERKHKSVEGIRLLSDTVKRGCSLFAVHQHAYALAAQTFQHCLAVAVPGGQLQREPLHAPGLVVAAQAAGGAFAIHAVVSQPYAHIVVAAYLHFPVVASPGETLRGQHLGADGEAGGAVGVVGWLLRHRGLRQVVAQLHPSVSRLWIQGEHCGVCSGERVLG